MDCSLLGTYISQVKYFRVKQASYLNKLVCSILCYDEFNDNVRRLMCSKQSEPQMTVEPQKRRTVRISKKWTETTKIRGPTYLKQMEPDEPLSRPRTTSSVFLFGAAHTTCQERNNKPQEEDIPVCSNETYSTFQRPKKHRRCKPTAMALH